MSDAKKLGFAVTVLSTAVLLSKVFGMVRDVVVASLFGANGATDAFYAAFTIPDWLNYLVAGGTLSITFIPIYARHLVGGDEAEGNRVFSIIATTMAVVVVAGVVVLEWFTPALAGAYLHKLRPQDLELAISLTRILLPAQVFFYLGGLASATLFARYRFVAAAFAPLVYNFGTIAGGLLLSHRLGIASLAWGTLAGAVLGPFAIQLIAAQRAGLVYRPSLDVRHPEFKQWLLRSLPLMIGVSVVTTDDWFIRYFAAADVGAISCLNYARKLVQAPIAVAGQAAAAASLPFFARLFAEGKQKELGDSVTNNSRISGAVAALGACALAALALPSVDLLFRRGHFALADVAPTALYVAVFAIAIPLWTVQGMIARAFYAAGDTLTPMIAGTLVALGSLPLYYLCYRALGTVGLVAASDLGIFMHTAALLLLLPRRLATCRRGDILLGIGRAFAVGVPAAAAAAAAARYLPRGHLAGHGLALVQLAVGGLVFASVTALLARPLGASEVVLFTERLARRLRR